MIKKMLLVCLFLSLVFLVGCSCERGIIEKIANGEKEGKEGKRTGEIYTIIIENDKFNPVELEIKVGDEVEWVNKDEEKHSVTFEDARVDDELPPEGKVSYIFGEKEEARYFCRFHPEMRGSIIVS